LLDVDAMLADRLWLLVTAAFSIIALIAAGFGVAAVARSRNIDGSAGAAFLAVIPFLNLYLVFKRPRDFRPAAHPALRWMFNIVGVVAIVVIFGLSKGVDRLYETASQAHEAKYSNDPALQAKAMKLIVGSDIATSLAEMAAGSSADLPVRVDQITQLTEIRAEGTTLIRIFSVADDRVQMTERFRSSIAKSLCSDAFVRQMLDAGATFEETYVRTNGQVIGVRPVRAEDCQKL
jgi:hypothetical protein